MKLRETGQTMSEAVTNIGSRSEAPQSSTTGSTLSALQAASAEVETEIVKAPDSDNFNANDKFDINSAANILAGKSTPSPKNITFDEEPLAKATKPSTPAKKATAPTGRPSKRPARGLDKTVEKNSEGNKSVKEKKDRKKRDKEKDRRTKQSEGGEDEDEDEDYEPPEEEVAQEDRDIARMKSKLENNNSSSLDEAKSRQRRAVEQRASMNIKLKMPDDNQPLLRAAAKGDVAALEVRPSEERSEEFATPSLVTKTLRIRLNYPHPSF